MPWRKLPLDSGCWQPPDKNPLPFAGLLSSLPEEYDYECVVTGTLPDVSGTLYRVGPGLYDRGPDRKRMMLDGDGMVQALTLDGGRARFRNRYVRTNKYLAEELAGRFLYPTFSCHGSGPLWHNIRLTLPNQANTTVIDWGGKLWAFDEGQPPYALNHSLETLGQPALDPEQPALRYWAHWKLDTRDRQLHCMSFVPGPKPSVNVVSLDQHGRVQARQTVPMPRSVYVHDWFVTPRYFAFLLHPAFIDFAKTASILLARETFSEAIQWQPERGGILVIAERGSGQVWNVATPACWMWHAINSYEDGKQLVLDFIASSAGGGLGDGDSPLFQVMRGREPGGLDSVANHLRRFTVEPGNARVADQVLDDSANFELPTVSNTERGLPHTWAYMIRSEPGELFPHALSRWHRESGTSQSYRFSSDVYCGEAIFMDEVMDGAGGERGRYFISELYSASTQRGAFAIFDETQFEAGPIAEIELTHHVPISFHGYWSGRRPQT